MKGADGMINFSTVRGDITIAPGMKVQSKGTRCIQNVSAFVVDNHTCHEMIAAVL